jgi:general secretion pathway protein A
MYTDFFYLERQPFSLTPDPEFLYLTKQHQEALAGLAYAILGCKGFVVLTGDAGTGKTTLLMRTMQQLTDGRAQCSIVVNPTLTPREFLEAALLDFGFTDIPDSKARLISNLQDFLWKGHQEGRISALIVDEAHKLSPEVLEEIRLLGNFESAKEKMLQIVLVGQSELDESLDREQLRQFKQRIALRIAIQPLSDEDVGNYLQHRWTMAGGGQLPFSKEALATVIRASRGIPRLINVICENALMEAYVSDSHTVTIDHLNTVCKDMHLNGTVNAPIASVAVAAPSVSADAEPFETMKFLERYDAAPEQQSFMARLRSRLGIA